ncbi:PTS Man IIC [Lactobacillus helsingborgensis]|jgi:Phosphotransferase system, mannose/fructose/N-acetylgalactosamine-specific component IIC|uniref:PTS mannose/fructose/sorbose/N-acetylgalactosamine transporter subunit IIC n=1 Tax=Lactobacillus TaxID=1578 RepID=UPI00050D2706|nr:MULTISPECIES: PTS sugar transporter subunit IIC [Lactobacillus]AIS08392.1 PTS system, sorbose-specific IID component [Lactobacillus sp. wkB8]MCT6902730.1 PTS sugar transporter subunit IIC [Lactobacillus sp.]AWN32716.1 PTS sugar transporter subunit IIC [Lactobacillus helsingborgensis]KJY66300.1 PTS Man IIC [Lactobacillus helsingborgensis]MBC6357398.1 PTS sugar transporter subunit IIC [Lactobacillus helsingborgensis]
MLVSAILVCLIATIANWWPSQLLTRTWFYPLWTGLLVGLALGKPMLGMQAGAYINLAYLGWITAGGTMPGNLPVAAVFGPTMTILANAKPSLGVSFAVPFSLFGILTFQITMSLNSIWVHRAEKYLDQNNIRAMRIMNFVPSGILNFLVTGVPAFILVYFGAGTMRNLLASIPNSLVQAMQVVGAIMPALGIAMLLNFMGTKKLMPFYFLGFLLTIYLKLDIIGVTALAVVMGVVFYQTGFLEDKKNNETPKEVN